MNQRRTWKTDSGVRPPSRQNGNATSDLGDSDNQDIETHRRSQGLTNEDAICLLSSDDDTSIAPSRPLSEGTAEEPIPVSDETNAKRTGRPAQSLQWKPRLSVKAGDQIKTDEQASVGTEPLGSSSNAICIDSDDDEAAEWKNSSKTWRTARISPFRRSLASPSRNQARVVSSAQRRKKATTRKKAAEVLIFVDSSDDEERMETFFDRQRKRLLEAAFQEEERTSASEESDVESESSSDHSIPSAAFATSQIDQSPTNCPPSTVNNYQHYYQKECSTTTLKPPPTGPTATRKEASGSAFGSSNNIGAAHGKHLAPIFQNALATNKNLDIEEVSDPETGGSVSRQHPLEKHISPVSAAAIPMRSKNLEATSFERTPTLAAPMLNPPRRENDHEGPSNIGRVHTSAESKSSNSAGPQCSSEGIELDNAFEGGTDKPVDKAAAMHPSNLTLMAKIDHLCSFGTNAESSLPTYTFSVHGDPDDIIYDFEMKVRTSKIPNAGRGVFLTFLGARELKPSRKRWGQSLVEQRPCRHLGSSQPLAATLPSGYGVSVKLEGKHLHGPYNCPFLLPTLKATLPGTDDIVKVRFAQYEDPYCEEELAGMRKEVGRIGLLGLYTVEDYVPAPKRTFSSLHQNCGVIEIDRYGPFQRSDRKTLCNFDIKGFVFSKIPNEWAFDVEEPLNGRTQIVDITDDVTGEPHQFACQHIPMYVNEVGHDKNLKQTVHALLDEGGRTVLYYIAISEPMKKGDTIELLVAYEGFYEEVRERKGYALSNLNMSEKSDDHAGSFLNRNFGEREAITNVLASMPPIDLYLAIDWLGPLHAKLADLIGDFVQGAKGCRAIDTLEPRPLSQQLVALRRISWIGTLLQQKLDSLAASFPTVGHGIFFQSSEALRNLRWASWQDLFSLLEQFPDIEDSNGKKIKLVFEAEIVEETCYAVRSRIVKPMEESQWCRVSTSLLKRICIATAKTSWKDPGADSEALFDEYVRLGMEASSDIRGALDVRQLAFFPMFKGSSKALEHEGSRKRSFSTGEVITNIARADSPDSVASSLQVSAVVLGTPIPIENATLSQVDETWYLCWQIIYVIDSFARKFLRRSGYSLEKLCKAMNVDSSCVSAAIRKIGNLGKKSVGRKQKLKTTPRDEDGQPTKKKKINKAMPASSKFREGNLFFWHIIWSCLTRECGWHLEHGRRPNDFCAFPPGVSRGRGFKIRVDYFDSVKLVLTQVRSNPKWSNIPALKEAVKEYDSCNALYKKVKGTKSMPKSTNKEEVVDWFRSKVAAIEK